MTYMHYLKTSSRWVSFKTQASRVLRRVREEGRPIVITQNGRPAAVLLSPEEFDRLTERERFMTAVATGLADVEAGRILDDEDVERELAGRGGDACVAPSLPFRPIE